MERKFTIITDTGCDMPTKYLEENGVTCIRLGFTMNGVSYGGEDGADISETDFYRELRGGAMPTTYQITGETARKYLSEALLRGEDVLALTFSGGLSGTAGSFQVAARELAKEYPQRKIFVVDSLCASMGQGLLLHYILKFASEGATVEETAKYAEGLKGKICHHFTVDNLFHLKRGGRVSSVTAIVGSILKIKPVLKVDDEGKLVVVGKAMGRKKSLKTLVDTLFERKDMDESDEIFISHGDCLEDAEYVRDLILERMPKVKITIHFIGSVIGTHSGAGTVALFHKGLYR